MSASGETSRRSAGRPRAAVMTDVAKLAGVSHQTVSRVINGSPQVRPATRERVLAAMDELDYRPNSAARALVTGRSQTLGVVSFDTTLYGPASTLYAIERAAHDAGYFIMIVSLEALDRDSVLSAVDRLRAAGRRRHPRDRPAEGRGRGARRPAPRPPARRGRGRARRRAAGRHRRPDRRRASSPPAHLLELGHPTVAHIAGPPDFFEAELRIEGWRAALAAAGAEAPPVLAGDWSPRSGYELGAAAGAGRRRSARSSSPTTRWRSARCARCTRRAARSRGRSASSASTTSPRRSTSRRR